MKLDERHDQLRLLGRSEKADELVDRSLSLENVAMMIGTESQAQYKKHGFQRRRLFEWLAFITEEHGELSQAMSEYLYRDGDLERVAEEAVQVATLAIKVAYMARRALDGVE